MNAGELTLPIRERSSDSQPSFEALMALHQQRVLRTAYRLLGRMEDAQDASQEVFLRLLRNLDQVDGDPQAWLYRVTVNVCNDQFRPQAWPWWKLRRAPIRRPPCTVLEMDDRKPLLMAGLGTLPERERSAVVLRDIEGLPTREVAEILGVEEVTVRTQICNARMKLAKYVRSRNDLPGMPNRNFRRRTRPGCRGPPDRVRRLPRAGPRSTPERRRAVPRCARM